VCAWRFVAAVTPRVALGLYPPFRTFSWLSGAPVERLTVVRAVAERTVARTAA
jgi:hypothetical protein